MVQLQNPIDDSDGLANENSQLDAPKSIKSGQRLKIKQNPNKKFNENANENSWMLRDTNPTSNKRKIS